MSFHIILFQPEIPPNTGNIIRLCANSGSKLSIIKPMGFVLDDKRLQRAGLDYHEWAQVQTFTSLTDCIHAHQIKRVFPCTTKAKQSYSTPAYGMGDAFLFGPESRGLPSDILEQYGLNNCLKIPMQANSRSLNLSNAVAIILYEALRQLDFANLE